MKTATEIFDYINKDTLDKHLKTFYSIEYEIGKDYNLSFKAYSIFKSKDEYIIYVGYTVFDKIAKIKQLLNKNVTDIKPKEDATLVFLYINSKPINNTFFLSNNYYHFSKDCSLQNNHLTIKNKTNTVKKASLDGDSSKIQVYNSGDTIEYDLVTDPKEKYYIYNLLLNLKEK